MSRSNDAGHFFQTTASIEDAARKELKKKNKLGSPVKLPSKILAVAADPDNQKYVYVAEAAGTIKRVNVDDGTTEETFRTSQSPITCVGVSSSYVCCGAWDKNVYGHDRKSQDPKDMFTFSSHTDFVKAVLILNIGNTPILVSASADTTIAIWDASSGKRLHQLKGHSRGVTALALEGVSSNYATIVSGDSNREIRRWHISPEMSYELTMTSNPSNPNYQGPIDPLLAHETSIYALMFDNDGDLWTASADKTAKCLSSARGFKEDTALQHPDFVRAIAIYERGGLVVTACRDENVRIWEKGSGRLMHVYEGHYEEVTGIVVDEERGRAVSVSIDGTMRVWGLKTQDFEKYNAEVEEAAKGQVKEEKETEVVMTAEEEAELAELMGSDDD